MRRGELGAIGQGRQRAPAGNGGGQHRQKAAGRETEEEKSRRRTSSPWRSWTGQGSSRGRTAPELLPEHGGRGRKMRSTSMNQSAPLWCLLLGTDRTSRHISWTSWTSATVGEGAARRRSCTDTWRWRFSGTLSCERDREDGERGMEGIWLRQKWEEG
jgi:hypothetical protein